KYRVTNFLGAPTVYRALRAAGPEPRRQVRLHLRALTSGGETLSAHVIAWAESDLGVPLHDVYGQSELASIFICNARAPGIARPIRPGSMGLTAPGYRVVLLDERGHEIGDGRPGQIAVDTRQSPLYAFRGYWNDPVQTAER